jgi:prepilin-type N-terminal cleavage/methylation domain
MFALFEHMFSTILYFPRSSLIIYLINHQKYMKNQNNSKNIKNKSFTLIELIIVLSIISILVTILIATIKPIEIFKKTRDSKRIADLKNIEKTIDLLYSTYPNFNELNYASTNIVYISLKDNSPTCSSYISKLPSLPSGYQYRCSANPQI